MLIPLLASLLSPALALDTPPESDDEAPEEASRERPEFGLGVRIGAWHAESAAPMIGGHLALRLHRNLRLQAFADHAMKGLDTLVQVDHVIGFHGIVPVVHWRGGAFGPTLGSCVDFRVWRERGNLQEVRTDVLFGPRAGLHIEQDLDASWSVQATSTAVLYVGNSSDTYGWGSQTNRLAANGIVQAQVGITRRW